MTKTFCDVCGEECKDKIFLLPSPITFVDGEGHDFEAKTSHLCKKCRNEIWQFIERLKP